MLRNLGWSGAEAMLLTIRTRSAWASLKYASGADRNFLAAVGNVDAIFNSNATALATRKGLLSFFFARVQSDSFEPIVFRCRFDRWTRLTTRPILFLVEIDVEIAGILVLHAAIPELSVGRTLKHLAAMTGNTRDRERGARGKDAKIERQTMTSDNVNKNWYAL